MVVAGPPEDLPSWERLLLCSPSPEDEGMELGIPKGGGEGWREEVSTPFCPIHPLK